MKKKLSALILLLLVALCTCACGAEDEKNDTSGEIVLRICNWEEYIDEGDWEEDELIELDNGVSIIGENPMVEDFENWYYETYGKKVAVEYSTFGTNEDLYNQLTLGDVYDLVCPSDYMIMKLMSENKLVPFSEEFFDEDNEYNYYVNGVSDYIRDIFETNTINDEAWAKYAAGYMWGTTGVVYNPELITEEEASSWNIFTDKKYERKLTIKDNVRDSMFAALGIVKADELTDPALINSPDYNKKLQEIMNDTTPETVNACEDVLKQIKDLAYSFETDSGKADMVTGKVLANYQWSGDAVYTLDQAEEDDMELCFAVPEECSNLWFDGWIMLKNGIDGNAERQHAAEAFINFMSRPDNAVRNMYYIGYTSSIAGGDDDTVFEYMNYTYGAEEEDEESEDAEEAEETIEYDVSYFFGEGAVITAYESQTHRQLMAQYPTEEIINRCAIMWYFDDDAQKRINQMWINVRCFDLHDALVPIVCGVVIIVLLVVLLLVRQVRRNKGLA